MCILFEVGEVKLFVTSEHIDKCLCTTHQKRNDIVLFKNIYIHIYLDKHS